MPAVLRARVLQLDGCHALVRLAERGLIVRADVADIAAGTGLPALALPGREFTVWASDDMQLWGWKRTHPQPGLG